MGDGARERQRDGSSSQRNANDVSAILLADANLPTPTFRKPEAPNHGVDKQDRKDVQATPAPIAKPKPELPDNPLIPHVEFSRQQQQANGLFRYNLKDGDSRIVQESATRTIASANGDYSETYYSASRPAGNFTVNRRLQADGSINYNVVGRHNENIGTITVRKDGTSSLRTTKDSSGREQCIEYGADQKVDREVLITTDAIGTTEEHSNGARRVRYKDGSLFERSAVTGGTGTELFKDRHGKEIFQESFSADNKYFDPGPGEKRLRDVADKLSDAHKKEIDECVEQF